FVIPKPLHRWEFLVGKFAGIVGTLTLIVALMSVILATFVALEGGRHGITMVRAEVLIWLELVLLSAVALLFSAFSSPYLSAMFTGCLWIIGRNTLELRAFAQKFEGTPLATLLQTIARVVPD